MILMLDLSIPIAKAIVAQTTPYFQPMESSSARRLSRTEAGNEPDLVGRHEVVLHLFPLLGVHSTVIGRSGYPKLLESIDELVGLALESDVEDGGSARGEGRRSRRARVSQTTHEWDEKDGRGPTQFDP